MKKKEEIIANININYRTILCYGKDEIIPLKTFIVKDITNGGKVILISMEDKNTEIEVPIDKFIEICKRFAEKNADKLSTATDTFETLESVKRKTIDKINKEGIMAELIEAETISLEDSEAEYFINGEKQALNYSLCTVDLGRWREIIKEKTTKEMER